MQFQTQARTGLNSYPHTCADTLIHTHQLKRKHAYYTQKHTRLFTHMRTHTCTNTLTHTYTQTLS